MRRLSFLAALCLLAPADDTTGSGASPTGGSPASTGDAGASTTGATDAGKQADGQQEPGKPGDTQEAKDGTKEPAKDTQPDKKADATETKGKPEAEPKLEAEPRETRTRVELAKRAKDLEARESKVKLAEADHAELSRWRELKSMAQQDSVSVLEELGITVEQVFKHAKEGQKVDPTARKALAKIAALEKQNAERDAAEKAARDEETAKANRAKLDGQLKSMLGSEADRFELTLGEGKDGLEAVHDALVAYTLKAGKPPSAEVAKKIADNVEKFYRARADRYEGSKYIKGKRNPAPAPKKPAADSKGLDNELDTTAKGKGAETGSGSMTEQRDSYMAGLRADIEAVKAERAARAAKEAADGRK